MSMTTFPRPCPYCEESVQNGDELADHVAQDHDLLSAVMTGDISGEQLVMLTRAATGGAREREGQIDA